jgi:hypothetical protein
MQTSCAVQAKYFDAQEASAELEVRSRLKVEVERWWIRNGWGFAPLPSVVKPAVLARQLATFRYEDATFAVMAENSGMTPVWLSYNGDRMHTASSLKRTYLQPIFSSGVGRNGGLRLRKEFLASIQSSAGTELAAISTSKGVSLVQYHNMHQDRVYPGAVRADNTRWLRQIGKAKDYYLAYLSIFIAHAVLFEDYHGGESGAELGGFTDTVFEPAYEAVTEMFGMQPLMVRLPWWSDMQYYPSDANWRAHGVRLV